MPGCFSDPCSCSVRACGSEQLAAKALQVRENEFSSSRAVFLPRLSESRGKGTKMRCVSRTTLRDGSHACKLLVKAERLGKRTFFFRIRFRDGPDDGVASAFGRFTSAVLGAPGRIFISQAPHPLQLAFTPFASMGLAAMRSHSP
jgi:hypothetical protein